MARYSCRQRNSDGTFIKNNQILSHLEMKERNKEYQKIYRKKNIIAIRERAKNWAKDNRHVLKKWEENNIEKVREIKKRYKISRPDVILVSSLRARLVIALKYQSVKKRNRTMQLIGCSISEFRDYISKMFKEGMTWDNWGLKTWHLDHIKPLSKFDLTDLEQQKIAFHYTNIQPLWAIDNLKKGNKYDI